MPKALSMDIHRRVFEARQAGETTAEVAERFSVSEAFVRKLMQHHREKGFLKIPGTGQKRGRKLSLGEEDLERLRQLVTQQPDLCARELRERLGLSASDLTVWRALKRDGFTFKKRHNYRQSKRGRM
jgi:transposase